MAGPAGQYYDRFVERELRAALADTPVVALNGARQVGKSTLVRHLAERHGGQVHIVTLDDPIQLAAAASDPLSFVERDGLLVVDEVQRAPELLPVIKAAVDRDRRAGRFLLTGSTRLLSVAEMSHSLAGRVEIVDLWPLSQGEQAGRREAFVDALLTWSPELMITTDVRHDSYFERICAGGFPEPLTRSGRRRSAWFRNYATTVVERMVLESADVERADLLPRLLRLCAARTAGELNVTALANDAAMPARTASVYLGHRQRVFLLQLVPAWSRNLTSKGVHRPKVVLTDTGLASFLLGVDPSSLARPASPLGALFETFVAVELRKQLGWSEIPAELYHFRDRGGAEVDLVLEARDGRVGGIEVKASRTVTSSDFNGLRLLQERLGEDFAGGVVLYRGNESVRFGERLLAVPASALWEVTAD